MILVRYDEDEAAFKRTRAERLFCGGLLVFFTCLLGFVTVDTIRGGPAQRDHLPLCLVMLFVLILPFACLAGPNEMRFDLQRKRYQSKIGFLFLSWTRSGNVTEIAQINVWNNLKLTGLTLKWKNTQRTASLLARCETGSEAQALAEKLGASLGVLVNVEIPHFTKKSIR